MLKRLARTTKSLFSKNSARPEPTQAKEASEQIREVARLGQRLIMVEVR